MTTKLRRASMAFGLLFALAMVSLNVVSAGVFGISLYQCANGPLAAPIACTDPAFQHGDLNASNSHYREGDVVPFRDTITGLTAGTTYSLTISWEFLKGGTHAYDYITTYNTSETTADPCTGVAGAVCTSPSTFPIPPDPTLVAACNTFNNTAVPQIPGSFTLWGGTLIGVGPYSQLTCGSGTTSQSIVVTFTANQATEVLSWGGHIASQTDWGAGAGSISGSPYHMHQLSCNVVCGGDQDRSLKVVAFVSMSTSRSPAGAIVANQNVFDTATITGSISSQFPSGTVQFYTCYLASTSTFPTCNTTTHGPALGSPVTVTGSGTTGSAQSPNFSPNQVGRYCFLAVYNSTTLAYNGSTDTISSSNTSTECFSIQTASAVTVSSMSAVEMDNGAGWAMVGLGALGIVTLGAVVFVFARKR